MSLLRFALPLTSFALFTAGCATTSVGPSIPYSAIDRGTNVEITAPGQRLDHAAAVVEQARAETIYIRLAASGSPRVVPLDEITEMSVLTRRRHIGLGLWIGGGIGLGVAAILMGQFEQQSFAESLPIAAVPALVGALLGAFSSSTTVQPIDMGGTPDGSIRR